MLIKISLIYYSKMKLPYMILYMQYEFLYVNFLTLSYFSIRKKVLKLIKLSCSEDGEVDSLQLLEICIIRAENVKMSL